VHAPVRPQRHFGPCPVRAEKPGSMVVRSTAIARVGQPQALTPSRLGGRSPQSERSGASPGNHSSRSAVSSRSRSFRGSRIIPCSTNAYRVAARLPNSGNKRFLSSSVRRTRSLGSGSPAAAFPVWPTHGRAALPKFGGSLYF
jgi:hypothetical protein